MSVNFSRSDDSLLTELTGGGRMGYVSHEPPPSAPAPAAGEHHDEPTAAPARHTPSWPACFE